MNNQQQHSRRSIHEAIQDQSSARGMINAHIQNVRPSYNRMDHPPLALRGLPRIQKQKQSFTLEEGVIPEKEKVNMCVTLFLLLPISFSGPCVSFLAYSFHLCGVFFGLILFTIASVVCIYSSYLLLKAAESVNVKSYHDLAGATTGKCVKMFMMFLQTFCLIGPSISACLFNRNLTVRFLSQIEDIPEVMLSKYFWAAVFVWLGIFPWLAFPRLKGLKYVSYVTSLTSFIFALLNFSAIFKFGGPKLQDVKFFDFEFQPTLISFTFFIYPIVYQPNIQTVFNEMKNSTVKRSICILTVNTFTIMATYCTIGIFGYLVLLREHSQQLLDVQNVFRTMLGEWLPVTIVGMVFIGTTLSTGLAVLMPVKMILLEFFKKKNSSSCAWNALAAFILCCIVCVLVSTIDKTSVVMRFNAVTVYPFVSALPLSNIQLSFVFPSLFFVRATHHDKSKANKVHVVLAIVLLFTMAAYGIFGLIGVVTGG